MATRRTVVSVPLAEFATALLAERETCPRATLIAQTILEVLPNTASAVYVLEYEAIAPRFALKGTAGGISVHEESATETGTLVRIASSREPTVFRLAELT